MKTEALRPLFKLETGEYYSQKEIRKGFQKAQEMYGAGGYMEFTGYPDSKPRDDPNPAEPEAPAALAAEPPKPAGPPTVDVTLRMQEGKQYFVNRIVFAGNTTTRDNVIRREMRLYENGVFNTEALKYSIRRLNQLGYFKALEGPPKDVNVDKTAMPGHKVDVRLKLEEQNRNQLTFGAGVSQFEGFFGQLSFQTANFLGRGESLTVAVQAGSRAQNYYARVHRAVPVRPQHHRRLEPVQERGPLHRPVHAAVDRRRPHVRVSARQRLHADVRELQLRAGAGQRDQRDLLRSAPAGAKPVPARLAPAERRELRIRRGHLDRDQSADGGADYRGDRRRRPERIISKVVPSLVYNTVDQPIFPTTGKRLTASFDLAGLGGNTNFYKPTFEGVVVPGQNARMSFGMRGQFEYIRTFGSTTRSADLREAVPRRRVQRPRLRHSHDRPAGSETGLVLGGNKSLLFNVEQIITSPGRCG